MYSSLFIYFFRLFCGFFCVCSSLFLLCSWLFLYLLDTKYLTDASPSLFTFFSVLFCVVCASVCSGAWSQELPPDGGRFFYSPRWRGSYAISLFFVSIRPLGRGEHVIQTDYTGSSPRGGELPDLLRVSISGHGLTPRWRGTLPIR